MSKLWELSEPQSSRQGNGGSNRGDVRIDKIIKVKCLACCLTYGKG